VVRERKYPFLSVSMPMTKITHKDNMCTGRAAIASVRQPTATAVTTQQSATQPQWRLPATATVAAMAPAAMAPEQRGPDRVLVTMMCLRGQANLFGECSFVQKWVSQDLLCAVAVFAMLIHLRAPRKDQGNLPIVQRIMSAGSHGEWTQQSQERTIVEVATAAMKR
jgi:hypothetical protein